MNRIAFSIVGASLLAVAGVATAGPAGATADDTVNSLKSEGYNVQINGTPSANLSACTVTGVKKDAGAPTRPPTSTFLARPAADEAANRTGRYGATVCSAR